MLNEYSGIKHYNQLLSICACICPEPNYAEERISSSDITSILNTLGTVSPPE